MFFDDLGCEILVKAEFLNPGGSVKDRAALYLIKDAQERGLLANYSICVHSLCGCYIINIILLVFDRCATSRWNSSRRNCWKYRYARGLVLVL
jgi:hypothetical protein